MGLGSERDLVPLGAGFDIVKRGYSRTQVEEHLERLDSDLRLIAADRDAAVSQAGDLARQMEHARSHVDELRAQVDRLSMPPTTLEGLSERLQGMLRLAQDEARDIRARGEADAIQVRARAEADGAALRNRYEKLIAEVDGRRVELETEHRELVEKSNAELAAKIKQAEDERIKADEEASARRTQIEDDFEIAMAARRTESMKSLAEQEATSKSEAERRVREATEEAARIKAKITAEENTSKSEAERRLRESSDEAAKVRAAVAEEQRTSKAEAERRVREATEEANRRRHDAITEAQARLQDAVDESNRRVREATEEANRRMNLAAGRVEALRALRAQIAEQLRAAHALMSNATPALDPLPEEQDIVQTAPAGPARPATGRWPLTDPAPEPAEATAGSTTTQAIANAPTRRNAPVTPPKNGQQGPNGGPGSGAAGGNGVPAGKGAPASSGAQASGSTAKTAPAGSGGSGGAAQRPAPAQPTTPNRPTQGVRREPTAKR
jgi:chemotaxis protein histidine kinase CheA